MTIRDLLSINSAWFCDYIKVLKDGKDVLPITQNSELHPAWLDYEIKFYLICPHAYGDDDFSFLNCDYEIHITGSTIIQNKNTCIDRALRERINNNESTDND